MIYLTVVLALISLVSIFYCLKFGVIIIRVQDTLEDALDIIDEKFHSITEICERPLFHDSPEVRKVLSDIKETRDSLHQIAFALSKNFENDNEEKNEIEGDDQ